MEVVKYRSLRRLTAECDHSESGNRKTGQFHSFLSLRRRLEAECGVWQLMLSWILS
jgi:hypothetical protein